MSFKNCPFCAEEIQQEAVYCRFCRRELKSRKKILGIPLSLFVIFFFLTALVSLGIKKYFQNYDEGKNLTVYIELNSSSVQPEKSAILIKSSPQKFDAFTCQESDASAFTFKPAPKATDLYSAFENLYLTQYRFLGTIERAPLSLFEATVYSNSNEILSLPTIPSAVDYGDSRCALKYEFPNISIKNEIFLVNFETPVIRDAYFNYREVVDDEIRKYIGQIKLE